MDGKPKIFPSWLAVVGAARKVTVTAVVAAARKVISEMNKQVPRYVKIFVVVV